MCPPCRAAPTSAGCKPPRARRRLVGVAGRQKLLWVAYPSKYHDNKLRIEPMPSRSRNTFYSTEQHMCPLFVEVQSCSTVSVKLDICPHNHSVGILADCCCLVVGQFTQSAPGAKDKTSFHHGAICCAD